MTADKERTFNRLWGDLSRYNSERARGIVHRPGFERGMRDKQWLYDQLSGDDFWDEERIRAGYPEQSTKAFDRSYVPEKDSWVTWHSVSH